MPETKLREPLLDRAHTQTQARPLSLGEFTRQANIRPNVGETPQNPLLISEQSSPSRIYEKRWEGFQSELIFKRGKVSLTLRRYENDPSERDFAFDKETFGRIKDALSAAKRTAREQGESLKDITAPLILLANEPLLAKGLYGNTQWQQEAEVYRLNGELLEKMVIGIENIQKGGQGDELKAVIERVIGIAPEEQRVKDSARIATTLDELNKMQKLASATPPRPEKQPQSAQSKPQTTTENRLVKLAKTIDKKITDFATSIFESATAKRLKEYLTKLAGEIDQQPKAQQPRQKESPQEKPPVATSKPQEKPVSAKAEPEAPENRNAYQYDLRQGQGLREYQEDSGKIGLIDNKLFMVIADGHGENSSSAKQLADYVSLNLGNHINSLIKQGASPENAFRQSFEQIHNEVRHLGDAGATVASLFINKDKAYFANVGDAVIIAVDKTGKPIVLTEAHNAANPSERARIQATGVSISKKGRIGGQIMVSRSIGDEDLKNIVPSMSHEPYVSYIPLKDIAYLISGSDGVTDAIKPNEIAEICHHARDAKDASRMLSQEIAARRGDDNWTLGVIQTAGS